MKEDRKTQGFKSGEVIIMASADFDRYKSSISQSVACTTDPPCPVCRFLEDYYRSNDEG